nr:DUF262 domain-containing protein [uncultured Bacteroides sp.]
METKDLNKSLKDIFQCKYIIPLYQRNFAWGADEIGLLLQDLYENFKKSRSNGLLNYFIGSLIVLRRKDGLFEVIDGQQRLTTLSLLLRILDLTKESKLFYESRPEVEAFFDSFYRNKSTNDVTFDYKVSHLVNAVDLLKETIVNPEEKEVKLLLGLDDLEGFKHFIYHQVILVRVEIPADTDVAAYFEVMNNRGDQLQKHEILKSYLMETLKDKNGNYLKKEQDEFSLIWDACSLMDSHIQKNFNIKDRCKYFGENYENINLNELLKYDKILDLENKSKRKFTINEALKQEIKSAEANTIKDIDDGGVDRSIIDFPNFLMHIFKLKYKTYTDNGKNIDIPLHEKYLIAVYNGVKERIDAIDFIKDLLYYRTIFDRYVVKATDEDSDEDKYKWTLQIPYKYYYVSRDTTSLKFNNSFKNQERLIKSLSLLQVSFRNRKYKNWLQDVLNFFSDHNNFGVSIDNYQRFLDQWIIDYFKNNISEMSYDSGVKTPHFLLNSIDYLLWVMNPADFNFKFTYRNSVEHHLPQSFKNEINESQLDSLGNLCLVSKSSNSKMNNEHPVGKAKVDGKYYKEGKLPPKQKIMYDITNENGQWGNEEINNHRKKIIELLNNKESILNEIN